MKNLMLFFLLGLLSMSCGNDDDNNMNTDEEIMEVEKDGISFTVTSFNNTLLEDVQADEAGRRLDIRGDVDGGTLIITVSNWNWQNPPENGVLEKIYDTDEDIDSSNTDCMEGNNFTYCDGGLGTYILGTKTYLTGVLDNAIPGNITISENDSNNRRVSGSFEFMTTDLFRTEEISFKGTFQNLKY